MSRVVTPPSSQPAQMHNKIPHDKISKRAFEKWVNRGRPHGNDLQDWLEAEAELKGEQSRAPGTPVMAGRR